jgi:hypothetical protein
MQKNRAEYEASAWILTMEVIGQKLRERYQQPDELPPELFALVKKLDKNLVRSSSAKHNQCGRDRNRVEELRQLGQGRTASS